jgi:hypothetical protein
MLRVSRIKGDTQPGWSFERFRAPSTRYGVILDRSFRDYLAPAALQTITRQP